jgi:NADH-ubiquinone oxidoreductase chain 4L
MFCNLFFFIGVFFYFFGIVSLSHQKRHLIRVLICLEILILGVVFSVFGVLLINIIDSLFCVVVVTFMVCERAIGLSLLVSMCRNFGSDYIKNFNSYF